MIIRPLCYYLNLDFQISCTCSVSQVYNTPTIFDYAVELRNAYTWDQQRVSWLERCPGIIIMIASGLHEVPWGVCNCTSIPGGLFCVAHIEIGHSQHFCSKASVLYWGSVLCWGVLYWIIVVLWVLEQCIDVRYWGHPLNGSWLWTFTLQCDVLNREVSHEHAKPHYSGHDEVWFVYSR